MQRGVTQPPANVQRGRELASVSPHALHRNILRCDSGGHLSDGAAGVAIVALRLEEREDQIVNIGWRGSVGHALTHALLLHRCAAHLAHRSTAHHPGGSRTRGLH